MAQAQVILTATDRTQAGINSAMRGLKGIGDQVSLLKRAFAGIGTVAVGQFLTRTATQAIQYGDEISKAAVKSGLAVEAISSLAYAAKQTDVDLGSLSTSIRKMQIALSEAATGGKSQKQALDALGLSIEKIKMLKPDEQFELLADRISMLSNPADRARAAVALFGKAGADLLPLFEQGAAGIRAAREEAEKLGIVLSDKQIKILSDADDAVKKFTQSWDALAAKLTAAVLPAITSVLRELTGVQSVETQLTRAVFEVERLKKTLSELPGDGGQFGKQLRKQLEDQVEIIRKLQEKASVVSDTPTQEAAPGFAPEIKETFLAPGREDLAAGSIANFVREMQEELRLAAIDFNDQLYNDLQKTAEEIADSIPELVNEPFSRMTEFAKQAAQSIQSSFADFLFDPFQNGLKGMLAGFLTVIRRMLAEVAASTILNSVFGGYANAGGFLGTFAKAITGRAIGGPVMSNTPYIVGERGPELFVPGTSGGIMPNNRLANMGGGVTVAPVYNIDARGATADLQKALPGILQENNRRIFDELDRRYGIGR
jgi:hypothetical protein